MQSSPSRHSARHQHRSPRHTVGAPDSGAPVPGRSSHRAAPARAEVRRGGVASKLAWTLALGLAVATAGAVLSSHLGRNNAGAHLSTATSSVPLLGSSVSNASQLSRNTSEFGRMDVVRVFYPGLPSASAWTGGMAGANHSAVVVSFNAAPGQILSGADDGALSHFFATAPRTYPIYWSYFHEPEDNIARGEFTAAAYRAAWAHIVTLANRVNNPQLHSTLILMAYDVSKYSHRNWKDYLPAGNIISTIGWDAYPALGSKALPPSQFMAPAAAAAKAAGLSFGFAEFGMYTSAGRAQWLAQVGSWLMQSGAKFGTLFDSSAVQPPFTMNDSSSIAAWRGYVTASANGAGAPAPAAKKAPAPAAKKAPAPATKSHSVSSGSAPAVSGLAVPGRVAAGARFAVSLRLGHWANVTVCLIRRGGTVIRTFGRPRANAGSVSVSGTAPGTGAYKVLVVASNAHGSTVAERTLSVG